MTMQLYKVLSDKGYAHHGGRGKWSLPNGRPGAWKTVRGELVPCNNGLHLCRRQDVVFWLGPAIFVAEYDGDELVEAGAKVVVRKARLVERLDNWNERTARLFAADCADRALRQVAKIDGARVDPRSRAAVRAAREFANGNISAAELAAAEAAAGAAARAAAGEAARADAWAAAAAAEAAARAAARETARAATGAAARETARAAARETARAATGAAARETARAAAGEAARAAAEAAECQWQTRRLFEYLDGKRGAPPSSGEQG